MPAMTSSHIESLYSLDGHSADIVSALNLQRQQVPSPNTADLCDVIVRCAGSVTATSNHDRQLHSHHHHQQPIRAHRCVLASGSEYFQTLFMSRVDGGRAALRLDSGRMAMVEVNLPFVSRDTASKVIDFLYTGSIRLSLDDISDVLRLADFLRIGRLLDICSTHLSSRVDRSNAVAVRHLVDTYNLSAVSPRLATDVDELVSRNLPSIVRSFGRRQRLCRRFPPETIVRLLNDDEIGSVRERDIYDAVCQYATVNEDRKLLRRDDDRPTLTAENGASNEDIWNLLDAVNFEYLPAKFLGERVWTNAAVIDWLRRRKPEVLRDIERRLGATENDAAVSSRTSSVDVVVCRSRSARAFDRSPVRLVAYDTANDEWSFVHLPRRRFAVGYPFAVAPTGCQPTCAPPGDVDDDNYPCDEHSLDGLESMTIFNGRWLYALCSMSDDAHGHAEPPIEAKRFWRLDLNDAAWVELSAPTIVQWQCRLASDDAEFMYVVDRAGRVERYTLASDRWTVLCRVGFSSFQNATLYVLPIPLVAAAPLSFGGRYRLYVVRAFSSGYCFYFSAKSVALYRLDPSNDDAGGEWDVLERSEIEFADLITDDPANFADVVHFHGYTLGPGRLQLNDELGRPRVAYDLTTKDWVPTAAAPLSTAETGPKPRFVGTVLGSAAHAGRVYCATRITDGAGSFVMFDHWQRQYKILTNAPVPLSGILCRATVPRSALAKLATPCGGIDVNDSDGADEEDCDDDVDFASDFT